LGIKANVEGRSWGIFLKSGRTSDVGKMFLFQLSEGMARLVLLASVLVSKDGLITMAANYNVFASSAP
jgi:hypothetical protein